MPARLSIFLMLIVSLCFGAQVQPAAAKMQGCAAMKCERGCCPDMACCASRENHAPQPMPMSAPQRGDLDPAAAGIFASWSLGVPPPVEAMGAAAKYSARPHAQPRRAVSCIFQI